MKDAHDRPMDNQDLRLAEYSKYYFEMRKDDMVPMMYTKWIELQRKVDVQDKQYLQEA